MRLSNVIASWALAVTCLLARPWCTALDQSPAARQLLSICSSLSVVLSTFNISQNCVSWLIRKLSSYVKSKFVAHRLAHTNTHTHLTARNAQLAEHQMDDSLLLSDYIKSLNKLANRVESQCHKPNGVQYIRKLHYDIRLTNSSFAFGA